MFLIHVDVMVYLSIPYRRLEH